MSKYKVILISVFLLLSTSFTLRAQSPKKVILITINTATLEDFLSNDSIRNYAENGIIGLFNSRSNGVNNQYKPHITIGSGQRGEVPFDCLESVKVDKDIAGIYKDITLKTSSENNMVNISINKLKEINSNTLYDAKPGKLGYILRNNSIPTAYLGGFWYYNSIKSPAFFIAMDENGLVDYGENYKLFTNSKMDSIKTLEAFKKYKDSADFIVIELGEIESLYANKRLYTVESYNLKKKAIIDECGKIVNKMLNSMDDDDITVCIISPYSFDITKKNTELLSPIIIYDGGKTKGIVTSSSTRRAGIVSAQDIGPFILNCFGIKNDTFQGHNIFTMGIDGNVDYIRTLNNSIISTSSSRAPVLKVFAIIIILTLAVSILIMLKNTRYLFDIVSYMMKLCMVLPFVFLIEGMLKFDTIFNKSVFFLTVGLTLTLLIEKFVREEKNKIIFITFINASAIIVDILNSQSMLKYSIFSYDPVIGARYYGLGNEFLGVLVGCTLIFGGLFAHKSGMRKFAILYLMFVTLVIGLPMWGSNMGGFVTSVFSFIVFILIQYGYSIRKTLWFGIMLSLSSILIYLFFNILFMSNQSHIGSLFSQTGVNGISYFINTVLRKINMALRLIKYTIWSRVLIILIIGGITAVIKPHAYINTLFIRFKGLKSAFLSSIAASCTAIVSNDSGIVTAAIIMLYAVFTMIILLNSLCLER